MFVHEEVLEITYDDYRIKTDKGDMMLFDWLNNLDGQKIRITVIPLNENIR